MTVGGTRIAESEFDIVSCSNNIKKGSASITIKGIGDYGGTKMVKFTFKNNWVCISAEMLSYGLCNLGTVKK